mmetsp:Transcript_36897/g.86170  ORF Transcript_36897/g.86170 Transcript_36897/m.86170 type:complete len:149 (-) Transcript_36897:66-512(-)
MAKVKDRLIFESKKIDAFEKRKAGKEQKLRAKETQSNKTREKAMQRKDNLRAVDQYAKDVASRRIPGVVRDDDDDDFRNKGPNKKRVAMDRKYGFGGKKGRFKKTNKKDLADMSNYNERGNFGGIGTKTNHKKGNKRPGKRARDAARK